MAEATERFGIRVHAYVLMDARYHLLVETPEANLSRVMQCGNPLLCILQRHRVPGSRLDKRVCDTPGFCFS